MDGCEQNRVDLLGLHHFAQGHNAPRILTIGKSARDRLAVANGFKVFHVDASGRV